MDIPEYPRVIYEYNPLNEVICQLHFPPILKIAEQKPVDFQESIRHEYPFFKIEKPQLPPDISRMTQELGIELPFPLENSYVFQSEDQVWQLSLTKEFIALKTLDYQKYEDFRSRFQEIIHFFEKTYQPSFYTRISLRYQDLIIRSKLNLQNQDWSELISENIAHELYNHQLSKSLKSLIKELVFETHQGVVILKHGLVNVENQENNIQEISYLIDSNFQTQHKVNKNDEIWNIIDDFNKLARNIFRFSITETLHRAMSPKEVNS